MSGRFQSVLLLFHRPHRSLTVGLDGPAIGPEILAAQEAAIAEAAEQGLTCWGPVEMRGAPLLSGEVGIGLFFQWTDPGSVIISCSDPLLPREKRILDAALAAVPGWARYNYRHLPQINPQHAPPITTEPAGSEKQATVVKLAEDAYELRGTASALAQLINAARSPLIVEASIGLALLHQIDEHAASCAERYPGLLFGVAGSAFVLLHAGLTLDRTRLVVVPDGLGDPYTQQCFQEAGYADAASIHQSDPNRHACMVKACQVAHWTGKRSRRHLLTTGCGPVANESAKNGGSRKVDQTLEFAAPHQSERVRGASAWPDLGSGA
jgi:hypothetical protein